MGDQLSSEDRLMPRYLAVSTSDNTWLHNEYMRVRGLRERDIRIILHLVALKRMPHVSPHSSSADRSRCSRTWSASERMGRYTRQSSANSRTCESTTLGRSFMWSRNNSGPRTVPWDTPESTVACVIHNTFQ